MFHVKICGITNIDDLQAAVAAGADAVGLNFCPASPRRVSQFDARTLAHAVPQGVLCVGVFVDATPAEVARTADAVGLGAIQLHGDEPPEVLADLPPLPIIRALRARTGWLESAAAYLERCETLGTSPAMVLVDAYVPDAHGGTGAVADWPGVRAFRETYPRWCVALAGGLRPDNVQQAVVEARPHAVDTASGVECQPGRKDAAKMVEFVRRARQALEAAAQGGDRSACGPVGSS